MNTAINTMLYIVGLCLLVASVYMLLQNGYSMFLSLFGFGNVKKDYDIIQDKTRFLILIAAHNEEAVIEDTIKNLRKIDYNKDLYDIYVVNDNSTDRTGEICDQIGVAHIDTIKKLYPREGVGKPAGLQYALRDLGFEQLEEKYDMLMILDADNYVDSNILKEINSQWQQKGKPEVIQTYLDSKNTDSILSIGYATAYWVTNRFFQLSKYKLGLPNAIGGTGFAVRLDWLFSKGGFSYKSLTEDLEMEIEVVKSGGTVLWNHFTRIYDEKPDDLKVSIKQRTRWSQGHWYVAFTNFIPLVKEFFKSKCKFKYIDQLIYLFGMGRGVQLMLMIVSIILLLPLTIYDISNLGVAVNQSVTFVINSLIPTTIINIILFSYSSVFLPIYAIKKDGRDTNIVKVIVGLIYFGTTYIYTQFLGLLKWRNQSVWVKTPHKHTDKVIENTN